MVDYIKFGVEQGILAASQNWYTCVQHLGTGGNAVTFLVLCTSGENKGVLFALKVFRKLSLPQRRERFLKEIDFLRSSNHPTVMRVFDTGLFRDGPDEFPFVVMEYLPQRLFEVIRGNSASTTQKISYALQLISALSYLAKISPAVVHRDIKPQNIFVKGGSCVLGDFGLMKLLDGNAEVDRAIFKESVGPGMPFFYRTPDLIAYAQNKSDITTKSDVFQLGLVLAELFTGRNPAARPKDHLDPLEIEPLGKVAGGLSTRIVTLLNRMLVFDADKREDAHKLLDSWQGLFWNAVTKAHDLDGRAI